MVRHPPPEVLKLSHRNAPIPHRLGRWRVATEYTYQNYLIPVARQLLTEAFER
jgi:hypothetical protein